MPASLEEMVLGAATADKAAEDAASSKDPDTEDTTATSEDANETEADDGDAEDSAATETANQDSDSEASDADDPSAIRNYAKEILGEDAHAWIDSYKSDDEFLRGAAEAKKLVGRRNADSEVVAWMRDNGITAEHLQSLITRGKDAADDKDSGNTGTNGDEWNPKWVTVNDKGEWMPTASAPADISARMTRYRARLAEAMADPAKLAEFVKPHLAKDLAAKNEEAQAEMQERINLQEQQRSFATWTESKKNLLFVEGTQNLTPLGRMVEERMQSGKINKSLGWVEQAEDALDWALAKSKPVPEKKTISPKAKHQTTPSTGSVKKMDSKEFFKKYGTDLGQWVEYDTKGVLPTG